MFGDNITRRAVVVLLLALSPYCGAQDNSDAEGSAWSRSVFVGMAALPAYVGDDSLQGTALPDLRLDHGDRFRASLLFGLEYSAFIRNGWSAGPVLRYDFGRTEERGNPLVIFGPDTEDLRGLGDVNGSFEPGVYAAFENRRWRMKLEARQGLSRGHQGVVAQLDAKYVTQLRLFGYRGLIQIGPELVYGSEDYVQTYFGITEEQSENSGLPSYSASAGIVRFGLHADTQFPVSDQLSLGFFASFDRLGTHAANSPLVVERGSPNQIALGLFAIRAF